MVKLQVRDRESIQDAVRRFRKLVERSGIKKKCVDVNITRSQVKSSDAHVFVPSVEPNAIVWAD